MLTINGASYLSSTEPPEYWRFEVQKESADPEMTEGNGCYSLAGAKYTLYAADISSGTAAAWKNATEKAAYTTDSRGHILSAMFPVSTGSSAFFLRETEASPGYDTDPTIWYIHVWQSSGSTTGSAGSQIPAETLIYTVAKSTNEGAVWTNVIYRQTLPEDGIISITSEEPPLNDPFALQLQKHDADTGETEAQGAASLEGALFLVSYWDNTEGNTSGDPYKTWVFQTDEDGILICRHESYLITGSVTVDGDAYISNDLYYDQNGTIVYPLGTYMIKEIQAPLYYQMEGMMKFTNADDSGADVKKGLTLVIKQNSEGDVFEYYQDSITNAMIKADNLAIDIYEKVYKASVTVQKYGSNGTTPLEGVEFTLTGDDGTVYMEKTNAEGEILFDELIPQHYVLEETATLDGYALLSEAVDITLPMEMTEEEAKAAGADIGEAVWDASANGGESAYCFYNVSYKVTDDVSFDLPATGESSLWPYVWMLAGCLIISMGLKFLFEKRRKEKKQTAVPFY